MSCWPTQSNGDLNAVAPDKIDQSGGTITIQFEGNFSITQLGPTSSGLMESVDDPDVAKRGGGYVSKIEVFVRSQVQQPDGSWNTLKDTSNVNNNALHCTEKNTYQRDASGTKTYRTRSRVEVTYCNGNVDQTPNGGGWQTSGTRDF